MSPPPSLQKGNEEKLTYLEKDLVQLSKSNMLSRTPKPPIPKPKLDKPLPRSTRLVIHLQGPLRAKDIRTVTEFLDGSHKGDNDSQNTGATGDEVSVDDIP